MAHPRRYSEDDFGLAELREICFSLPDVIEKETHGRPTFRTKKIFAVFGGMTKGSDGLDYPSSVLVKMPEGGIRALADDPRFFTPAYYGPWGWIGFDFLKGTTESGETDWALVRELVVDSYRETAHPKLVAQLEG